jgi:molybdopterin/thiamine biosynthesis adenylyltransferase/rhodanese-related sulfurtransferase
MRVEKIFRRDKSAGKEDDDMSPRNHDQTTSLSAEERSRYARHMLLPEVGEDGQRALKAARVLIVGLGGLGSPVALYLAAAGIGRLGLVDADKVDLSNLHRQILYGADDLGRAKAEAARQRLSNTNPHVACVAHAETFTAANAKGLCDAYDIVVDGTDNFAAHYLINDSCVSFGKSLVYGSVSRFKGQVAVVAPRQGPCYRCLYPAPPPPEFIPSCAEAGVLGTVPGLVGMIQANEVLKLILNIGKPLIGRILLIDGLSATFKEIQVTQDPSCPSCGDKPTITKPGDTGTVCAAPPPNVPEITAEELRTELASKAPPFILDVRNQDEYAQKRIEGSYLIPLPVLAERFAELDPSREIVVHCRSGGRSARAINFLQTKGFTKLRNLVGGIEGY